MIYDEENFLNDVLALIQDKLPAKLIAINSRKSDSITLDAIANEAYHFQTLDAAALNFRGFFILYGFNENKPTQIQNDNMLEPVNVSFEVGTFDNGERDRAETIKRLIRYRRALKEVLFENFDYFKGYTKPTLVSLEPAAFVFPNTNDLILSAGVEIQGIITAV
jgi:hypothetical protein